MSERSLPPPTLERLPVYVRVLDDLARHGETTASSSRVAELAGVAPAQVRKDLSRLGTYGTRGVGYDVADLAAHVRRALRLSDAHRVIVVGAGHLGQAVARYGGLRARGFEVVALTDVDPAVVGRSVDGVLVRHEDDLAEVVASTGATLAVLAVPPGAAQGTLDALAAAGVVSVLSFVPGRLTVPDGMAVRVVDVAAELQILSFYASSP
ncbi:redox-sensing transcriptional repressor Rex [Flavimobilis sp. GY10621]|uniref:Redox-sensing transcriptional repressor Rex n=1 Tax=Flavimobilis rhizosphaerae TaxID=2775421 RepID=A0ABR9DNG2_9MICO|nr:redox-sensing transcriptional repressor Rex [Flavimobilis rhizosphaerae]MBD9698660.1 redox-sensing transcriptional repressor Rex [Flavimobilis rhizosphaerae]